jgi:trehalose 6-phosphate synthase/phosphatase
VSRPTATDEALDRLRAAPYLVLLVDYDGTLVEFAPAPDLAVPDPGAIALLERLAARPRTEVHIASGRSRQSLEQWLGALPVWLHAEHGAWSRGIGASAWTGLPLPPADWQAAVRRVMDCLARRTPGTLVEEKTAGLAWHYRMADPELGAAAARELRLALAAALGEGVPLALVEGAMVIEVRPAAAHKGSIVPPILDRVPPDAALAALGDDQTDEDLFAALPPDAVAVHIGPGPTAAGLRLPDPRAARTFLAALAG